MSITYVAVLVDPARPDPLTRYPGVSYLGDGSPVKRVRLRYEADGGVLRVSDFVLEGQGEDADHYTYRLESDGVWESASRDDSDWIIDADPSTTG